MKMFTILFMSILMFSLPLTASGQSDDSMDKTMGSMEKEMMSPFIDYDGIDGAMMLAESKPTVLFFHASWCPSCKTARKNFEKDASQLEDVNLVVVDYDTSKDLQQKYNVTYQHTFVQISHNGEALAKWNGGDTEELLNMIVKTSM